MQHLVLCFLLVVLLFSSSSSSSSTKPVHKPPVMYVHIGPSKTGTTYIQAVLASLRDHLPNKQFCWPGTSDGKVFAKLADALDDRNIALIGAFRSSINKCLSKGLNVIISSEHFHFMKNITLFTEFFSPYAPYIIAYRREYLSVLYSSYAEENKLDPYPWPMMDFLPYAIIGFNQIAENGNNRDVVRYLRGQFGESKLIIVDYDGVKAARKDIAEVMLCDVLHIYCGEALPVAFRASTINKKPDMAPYNMLSLLEDFLAFFSCRLDLSTPGVYSRLIKQLTAAMEMEFQPPRAGSSFRSLWWVSEEESLSYRREFSNILYNNHSAVLEVRNKFWAEELDARALVQDKGGRGWLYRLIKKLLSVDKIVKCHSSKHVTALKILTDAKW
ncbi:hypothetical protein EON64_09575 [archaeon]|nr:MAG: hypothetical protein EON64_09575 [archaeon]